MKTSANCRNEFPCERMGFTIVDLLVLVMIVAVLAGFQLMAITQSQDQANRAACSGNLRQFAAALHIYSGEFNNRLPEIVFPSPPYGNWPWDIDVRVTDMLGRYGAMRSVMYCPANAAFNNDATWNFSPGGFRIIGYVPAISTTHQLPAPLVNSTLFPDSSLTNRASSQRVLVADVTASYNSNYASIPIGGLPQIVVQRTSHLNGTVVAGRNAAMLDGHVEWADRKQFTARFGGGATPVFEW